MKNELKQTHLKMERMFYIDARWIFMFL